MCPSKAVQALFTRIQADISERSLNKDTLERKLVPVSSVKKQFLQRIKAVSHVTVHISERNFGLVRSLY